MILLLFFFFFGNYIFKFTRMKTATVTVEWFQQNLGVFFNYKWTNTLKLHHTVSITVLVIFVDVSFFYKDAVMSGCHLDLKLDNVTGMYSTYLKIKATRDFIKDNNQVHQLGFQPLPGFPHAMWENYTIAPITVRKYYNDYTQVPKV